MTSQHERAVLENMPPAYLMSPRDWPDFKKATFSVPSTWGFKDWIYTCVKGGALWNVAREKGLIGQVYEMVEDDPVSSSTSLSPAAPVFTPTPVAITGEQTAEVAEESDAEEAEDPAVAEIAELSTAPAKETKPAEAKRLKRIEELQAAMEARKTALIEKKAQKALMAAAKKQASIAAEHKETQITSCSSTYTGPSFIKPKPTKTTVGVDSLFGIHSLPSTGGLDPALRNLFGISEADEQFFGTTIEFYNISTKTTELASKLPVRQKFWNWLDKSLRGSGAHPGPYYYLMTQVDQLDVAALYKRLSTIIDKPTLISHSQDVQKIFRTEYKPGQDFFQYLASLKLAIKKVHGLNMDLPVDARVWIPDGVVRSMIIQAMESNPMFKTLLEKLMCSKPEEWASLTLESLYQQLDTVATNQRDFRAPDQTIANYSSSNYNNNRDRREKNNPPQANSRNQPTRPRNQPAEAPKECYDFQKGTCKRNPCKFAHSRQVEEKKNDYQRTRSQNAPPQRQPPPKSNQKANTKGPTCLRCGEGHLASACNFKGACKWCSKIGHKESVCKSKLSGRERVVANVVRVDGEYVQARMVICLEDVTPQPIPTWYFEDDDGYYPSETDGEITGATDGEITGATGGEITAVTDGGATSRTAGGETESKN